MVFVFKPVPTRTPTTGRDRGEILFNGILRDLGGGAFFRDVRNAVRLRIGWKIRSWRDFEIFLYKTHRKRWEQVFLRFLWPRLPVDETTIKLVHWTFEMSNLVSFALTNHIGSIVCVFPLEKKRCCSTLGFIFLRHKKDVEHYQ